MFIKYCPDPILCNRLSFKGAEEWTTAEVQECIDSFQPVQPNLEPVHCQSTLTPTPAVDVNGMRALVSLLDRMMAHQNVQTATPAPSPSRQFAPGPFHRRNCQVCGDASHSTLMHCRKENLCLSCFAPGSMACTLNEEAECSLREAGVLVGEPQSAERIVLVGCGGKQTHPKGIYDLTLTVYGVRCIVPVIVVPGQCDELIISSNVLKHLMRVMKGSDDYWKLVSTGCKH
ncbi:hypothetical protein N1851_012830 [Merluccius polli]|uniref:Uncharacterized protein n=1 Tax=Merluccius polli TaxID=89951 RepID=A0AA47P227_MERPO|nr:hypothetical protein N1851_012830 [Merluccius polli]